MNVRAKNCVREVGRPGGRPVVLAHGFGCDQNLWRLVVPLLADRFRVVLFDHVGSGSSDADAWDAERYADLQQYADDILDIIEDLGLADVVFVGHSVAAMMGVLAAAARPQHFAGLVLLTPSPRYLDDDGYRGGFSRPDIDELLESIESNYLGWSRTMAPVIMGTRSVRNWKPNWAMRSAAPTRPGRWRSRAPRSCPTTGRIWRAYGCRRWSSSAPGTRWPHGRSAPSATNRSRAAPW